AEPDNLQIYLRMADVAYMMEDYVAMGNACEKAMLVDSENAQVLYRYAKACIGRDDLTNAIAMLTKAIMLNPKAYEAYLLRGETLLDSGDLDAADEDASHLLEQLADNEDVLILKARIEQKMGNKAEALTYYNKVIDVNPFSMVAFQERGLLRMELGEEQGGRKDVEMAEKMAAQLAADQAQGVADEDVEQKVKQAYKNVDAYGIFSNS
ncbi:tetratricopeptide repeat protein, partial [Prevotella sp. SGI.027]